MSQQAAPPHLASGASRPPRLPSGELDEAAIDAPSRQSVGILSVMLALTLVMWAAGRMACNYHEPGESLTPRTVSLEERTATPKDVALAFSLALAGADFATAQQLVGPGGEALIESGRRSCGACSAETEARPRIFAVAEVLSGNRADSYIAVRTVGAPGGEKERVLRVARSPESSPTWRVLGEAPSRDSLPALVEPAPGSGPLPPEGLRRPSPGDLPSGDDASGVPEPSAEPESASDGSR
jgi:hypothetical protein